MEYQVSALKYRPMTFASVVGQEALTTTLKNAIKSNKLAHAFLFCGPRGVGKTTCARIFAKTINCEHPTADGEACGECESCRAFLEQRSYNIFELDAASNNSVENIKQLMEQTRIPPQIGKYKVFIIDEVHMLSTQAFNAFLKTLEEPPSYVIFILATTEKNKLLILLGNPADIKSVEESIPEPIISAVFERPVNTEALLERLAYLTDVNATQDRLKHILIVDDDETFLKTVKNWLSRQYRVTIVTSGAQAMMYVADNQPDLILLDYEMPVTSGPQVLEMLRSEPKTAKIPVIFLTGKGDRDSVFQVLALKPEGYILKSSGRDKLVESVGSFFMKQLYDKLHD